MKYNPLCFGCGGLGLCFMSLTENWPSECPCQECVIKIVCSEACDDLKKWSRYISIHKTMTKIKQETLHENKSIVYPLHSK